VIAAEELLVLRSLGPGRDTVEKARAEA